MSRPQRSGGELPEPGTPAKPDGLSRAIESRLALFPCRLPLAASFGLLRPSKAVSRAIERNQRTGRALSGGPRTPVGREVRPDLVLLITLGSLRADRLGLYGHARE